MSVAHHAPPLHCSRGKLRSQEQQRKPAPFKSKDPSEMLSFNIPGPASHRKPLPGLALLSVTAANVLLRLLQLWAEVGAHFEASYEVWQRGQRESWLCRSYYWGLFPQTGREFLARNWKDFSGVLGFGPPRQNVRHGGQLHHGATVRARGGPLFQNNTDMIHCTSFETSVWCYVSICKGIFNQKREVKAEHTHTV